MMGRQHLALGMTAGVVLALSAADIATGINSSDGFITTLVIVPVYGTLAGAGVFAASTLGELFPDIDLETSIIGRVIKPLSHLINKIFGHRGFVHSLLNDFIVSFLLYFVLCVLEYDFAAVTTGAFFIGFLLHLLQDMITKGGVKLFWPLPFKIHLTNILSKSKMCWVITALLCAGLVLLYVFCGEAIVSFYSFICGIFMLL